MTKKLKKIDRVIKGLSDRYLPAAFAISEDLTKKLVKKDGFNVGTSFSIEPYDIESEEGDITTENKTLMAFFLTNLFDLNLLLFYL